MSLWKSPDNICRVGTYSAVFWAVGLFLCFANTYSLFAQAANSANDGTVTIRGTVVNSVTHAPVGHALVYSGDNRFAKLTDDEGRFEFKVTGPEAETLGSTTGFNETSSGFKGVVSRTIYSGIYFMARKAGYFQSPAEQPAIAADGPAEITISLVPEARIIGRVNLPANDGLEKIQVELYRRIVQEGHGQWMTSGVIPTRANGEFRFADLPEGDYKLFTHELLDNDPLTFNSRGPALGYPPVYYPAATDFETAATIHLKSGELFSATLTPSLREYFPVKLGLTNVELAGGFGITVAPLGHRGPGYSLGYDRSENAIVGMLPNGNYSVEVTKYEENGATGMVNFAVNGAPTVGPSVMLAPNSSIEVHVSEELKKDESGRPESTNNPNSSANQYMTNLKLVPQEELGNVNQIRPGTAGNSAEKSFVFENVAPGHYLIHAGCLPSWYVAAISSGGRNLLRQPLVVGLGSSIEPIEVTIRDDGAKVEGTIENWPTQGQNGAPRTSSSAVVLAVPTADSSGQFCQQWINLTGEFTFLQMPPGEYRILALDHMPEDLEYENTEAMRKYDGKSQLLRLVAGQHEHLRLTMYSGSN